MKEKKNVEQVVVLTFINELLNIWREKKNNKFEPKTKLSFGI